MKNNKYGKQIENNLIKSFGMAGISILTSPDLDHNYKIDFILSLNEQKYGIQLSLKNSRMKAINSKICALDVVPRFIYLNIAQEFSKAFNHPCKNKAKDLYNILTYITKKYKQKALYIRIDKDILNITEI